MADVPSTTTTSGWDTAAYNALAYFALRPQLIVDSFATVRATAQTHPGTSVLFTFATEMAEQVTPLTETADRDAVAIADTSVTVTLAEYGNAVLTTAKLRLTSYVEVDPIVANLVGYNAGISMDSLATTELVGGTNVIWGTGGASTPTSMATIDTEDVIAGDDVRYAVAKLRAAASVPFGGAYVGVIHPDVSYDLRGGTGTAQWRDVHTYSQPTNILTGEVGMFEGARFIESPRASLINVDGGAAAVDGYYTIIMGQEGLAKAFAAREGYGPQPQIVLGPIVDKLRRFVPIGWKHFVGYKRFREASLYRIESSSSIGTNA
jgi:N4-gp56 family major capsid protein